MSLRTITVGGNGSGMTVGQMRKQLARALSNLPGNQIVFFNFSAHLVPPESFPSNTPAALIEGKNIAHGVLAAPENS